MAHALAKHAVEDITGALPRQMLDNRPKKQRRGGHRRRQSGEALSCPAQHPNRAELRRMRPDPSKTKVAVRAQGVQPIKVQLEARVRRDGAALRCQGGSRDSRGRRPPNSGRIVAAGATFGQRSGDFWATSELAGMAGSDFAGVRRAKVR